MLWPGAGAWSDARDPMVVRRDGQWWLYYTGRDEAGWIVGLASAPQLTGPWHDWGAVLTEPTATESPAVFEHAGLIYLVYNRSEVGGFVRAGPTLAGPWSAAEPLAPGWAHEFWSAADGTLWTSYLTTKTVTIAPVGWDTSGAIPWPTVGLRFWQRLPLVLR